MRALVVVACLIAAAAVSATASAKTPPAWYTIEPDLRMCPSPLCGGWWLREVNAPTTRCFDRTRRSACYVAQLDNMGAGTTDERLARVGGTGTLLARGFLLGAGIQSFPDVARLAVTRAYARLGTLQRPAATFAVRPTGIVCVAAPCFSIRTQRLNAAEGAVMVSDADLSRLPPAQRRVAQKAYLRGDLVAAGRIVTVPDAGPAGDGRTFRAEAAYQRLVGA